MKTRSENKRGYALVTVMGIMTVLAITFGMLVKMGQQGAFTGKLLKDRTKASAYAEAGIEFAYALLRDDFDNRDNPAAFRIDTGPTYNPGDPLESTYGEGSFILSTTNIHDQYVIINSVGICGKSTVEAEAVIKDANYSPYGSMDAFTKAIAGGGGAKLSGGGSATNPDLAIHLNGAIVLGGDITVAVSISSSEAIDLKNKTIIGEVTAPVIDGNSTGVTVAPIVIPDIDFTDFYNDAVASSQYLIGNQQLDGDMTIPGGIMFVDGDVKIFADIVGTIIATGNITIVNGGIKENGFGIAAATGTGNISYNSIGNSEGLFYSRTGDFTQTAGDGTITGQIIVGGDVDKTGGGELIFEINIPGEDEPLGAYPVIAAWQK